MEADATNHSLYQQIQAAHLHLNRSQSMTLQSTKTASNPSITQSL